MFRASGSSGERKHPALKQASGSSRFTFQIDLKLRGGGLFPDPPIYQRVMGLMCPFNNEKEGECGSSLDFVAPKGQQAEFRTFRFFIMLLLVVVLLKAVEAGDSGDARNALNLTRTHTEVTLVTQTSWDRYWMLGHICARWRGPVVVAIFVPRLNGTENPYHTTPQGCNTQVGFKRVLHLAHAPKGLESYPVNVLRNTALRLVSTSHFLMVDIDFWPSSNLRHEILAHRPHATRRLAMVVPAFTRNGCVNPLCFTPRGSFLFGLSPHGSLFPPDCIPSQGAMWHFRELPQAADGRKIHAEKPY